MSENFKSREVGLRAQKKILSRMANKSVAKMLIDDTTASLLDNLYRLAKAYVSTIPVEGGNHSTFRLRHCPSVDGSLYPGLWIELNYHGCNI